MLKPALIALSFCATAAFGQTLTPEQIQSMVDERVKSLNPYAALLNDPDPARSLAALQIMMESGDQALVRMALEFGLLSTDPVVKRTAFEAFLTTRPILSIRFDGTGIDETNYRGRMMEWSGNIGPDGIGYWRVPVGSYSEKDRCFLDAVYESSCFVTVNADGIFLTPSYMSGRGTLSESGTIEGSATISNVESPVPFSIQLLD